MFPTSSTDVNFRIFFKKKLWFLGSQFQEETEAAVSNREEFLRSLSVHQ